MPNDGATMAGTSADPAPGRLVGVAAEAVARLWPRIEPLVRRGLAYADGRYAPGDVLRALLARDMQLWLVVGGGTIEAVCVTEILRYPRQRRCNIFLCAGGGMRRWVGLLRDIEGWAREQGCAAVELQGRPGWARVLKDYRRTYILLRKELPR